MENNQIRQINIDPELLKIPNNNGGSKRKHSTSEKSIRVRDPIKPKDHNKTTKRNALLKFIRRHQSQNAQKLLEENNTLPHINTITSLPRNEIDETLEYLMGVAEEVKKKEPQYIKGGSVPIQNVNLNTTNPSSQQYTLKHDYKTSENVSMKFPDHTLIPEPSNIVLNQRHLIGGEHPKYGCLRSGELPTYRQLGRSASEQARQSNGMMSLRSPPVLQKQQKPYFPKGWSSQNDRVYVPTQNASLGNNNLGSGSQPSIQGDTFSSLPNFSGGQRPPMKLVMQRLQGTEAPLPNRDDYIFGGGGNVKHSDEYAINPSDKDPSNIKLKILRQRRTSRRTFKIGKSKTRPKVGVLISNRTIRKNIATNALLLKQVPMTEIRRYLVKHNLITVGSNAPDYVLRKMYETSNTVCGEVFNHNNENLLHNFLHGKDE
jgi:hypothetical protein